MQKRLKWICLHGLVALGLLPFALHAQTPSPLQEWQYSGGIILERMFEPTPPDIHAVAGLGAEVQPAYEGSRAYKVRGGPALDIRYRDMAFASTGDGIGYNLIHRRGLELGLSMAYDSGRKERLDYSNLRGMGDKPVSAVPKAFVAWVISERFPAVIRADVRHLLRSGGGTVGDLGFYLPMPGSSERMAFFVGPSVTVANRHREYGILAVQGPRSAGVLDALGLPSRPSAWRKNLMACTGIEYCKLSFAETRNRAQVLVPELEKRLEDINAQLDVPITVNINGCPNSCARIQVADIGFKGQMIDDGDGPVEGFQVHLGGSLGLDSGFGRKLRQHKVLSTELGDYIDRVVRNFVKQREQGERFATWAVRADEADLR